MFSKKIKCLFLKLTKGFIIFGPSGTCNSITVQCDGKILAVGSSSSDFTILRYNANGDIAKYPKIAFKSSTVSKTATGYTVDGTLTIKGTAKKVQIPFTFTDGGNGGTFTGLIKLNRLDYGVGKSTVMVKNT